MLILNFNFLAITQSGILKPLTQMPVITDVLTVYRLLFEQADTFASFTVVVLKLTRGTADVDLDSKFVSECLHIQTSFLFDGRKKPVFLVKSHQMLM